MRIWKIKIDPDAIEDIRQIAEWYNEQKINLGKRFNQSVISTDRNPKIWEEKTTKTV